MGNEKYTRYIKSKKWKQKARRVRKLAGHRCQKCNKKALLHVHHKTYTRLGNEPLTDLIAVCEDCHKKLHTHVIDDNCVKPGIVRKTQKKGEVKMSDGESLFVIPFKKSKFYQKSIEDLPDSYLNWLLEQEWFETKFSKGYDGVKKELEYREQYNKHIEY